MDAGCRGRCSVAMMSLISAYSWMRIVIVGPCKCKQHGPINAIWLWKCAAGSGHN
jgi:hypothetical protein